MENGIRVSGGRVIPFPTPIEIEIFDTIPEGAAEGETVTSLGKGRYQKNVYRSNRLIGYAVYSNGMGFFYDAGFLHYEPAAKEYAPPMCSCEDCRADIEELDAQLFFDGMEDAAHANAPQRCKDCQYWHDTFYTDCHD